MKKPAIIIIFLLLPVFCSARIGWSFSSFSFLAGQQYRYNQKSILVAELQYDFFRTSCIERPVYYGASISYAKTNNFTEFGLKGMWNPTRRILMANNYLRFYPYMFAQANYYSQNQSDSFASGMSSIGNYGIRSGIGITGNLPELRVLNFRYHVQVGYHQPFANTGTFANSLVVEFKVGVGINVLAIKRNSQNKGETAMLKTL
jgi:hypothetical protein